LYFKMKKMKTISELRNINIKLGNPEVICFAKTLLTKGFDMDVHLPSKGINLQRDFCWSLFQQRELIWSMLLERNIPPVVLLCQGEYEVFQVIDGKQRLSSIISFLKNEFPIDIEGKDYLYCNLPNDYKLAIDLFPIKAQIAYEGLVGFTDEAKIELFARINFSGTPMEKSRLKNLLGEA